MNIGESVNAAGVDLIVAGEEGSCENVGPV